MIFGAFLENTDATEQENHCKSEGKTKRRWLNGKYQSKCREKEGERTELKHQERVITEKLSKQGLKEETTVSFFKHQTS